MKNEKLIFIEEYHVKKALEESQELYAWLLGILGKEETFQAKVMKNIIDFISSLFCI